jgi:uncharacterized protein (DUF433 family)
MSFISKTPGVKGCRACIRNIRIPVWLRVEARAASTTDASLLRDDPGLTQIDLVAAWYYVARNRAEIVDDILEKHLA